MIGTSKFRMGFPVEDLVVVEPNECGECTALVDARTCGCSSLYGTPEIQ